MSQSSQAFPESLDDILAAVQETARGRWFLEGYEARLKRAETIRILDAIAKLEGLLSSHSPSSADAALVERARAAIAATRRDIADIADKPASLSVEGQLFARLAGLSKGAFTTEPALAAGVHRALKLVEDLDREFATPQIAPARQNNAPNFFKQDEAVFEPAPVARPVVVAAKPEPGPEPTSRGAKLVIQRVAPTQAMPAAETAAPQMAEPAPIVAEAAPRVEPPVFAPDMSDPEETEIPHSRIVIIRRKADEITDVPFLSMGESTPASAA